MRGVIFDLDGTLINSLPDLANAMDHVLGERGLPGWSHAEYEQFIGEGARVLVRRALGERVELEDDVLAAFRARYDAHCAVRTHAYPGIDALLEALARQQVPTAILSNKPHPPTVEVVRVLFPRHRFVQVLGDREGHAKKPDPTSALAIARAMDIAPAELLFVGDTPIDVATARSAGMRSVGVCWGMRTRRELEDAGVDHLIATPEELLPLLAPR